VEHRHHARMRRLVLELGLLAVLVVVGVLYGAFIGLP
jgi:hypothetical protein